MTDKDSEIIAEPISPTGVVEVPAQHLDKVLEYINSLTTDEAEVSGYSFSDASAGGGFGSKGAGSAGRVFTWSACVTTQEGGDQVCGDKDHHR